MRDIKFRLWSEADKKYFTNISLQLATELWIVIHDEDGFPKTAITDYDEEYVLEQYTGIKDKNGKEIYEGDRLSMTDEVGKNGVVTVGFERGGFIIFAGLAWRYIGTYDELKNNIEVIGNIHDKEDK